MSEPLTVAPRKPNATFLNFPLHMDLDNLDAARRHPGTALRRPLHHRRGDERSDQRAPPRSGWRLRASRSTSTATTSTSAGRCSTAATSASSTAATFPAMPATSPPHYRKAEAAARKILDAGALLVSIGGDHGVPIPVFRACENHGPVTLVHVDAHLDWRDDVRGVARGLLEPDSARGGDALVRPDRHRSAFAGREARGSRSTTTHSPTEPRSSRRSTCWSRASSRFSTASRTAAPTT